MVNPLTQYEYLWDGSTPGWVLVRSDGPEEHEGYSVYNKESRMLCLIEDDTIHRMVCEKLLSQGAEVLDRIPRCEFNIQDISIEE